ncbi:acetylornithine deacetylase, partial [Staphylococcus aureus]
NNVASGDVWLRENPLQFEWGGESMIEDRGEIFPSFTIPTEHPGFALLRECHEAVWDAELEQGVSTTVADGGWLHT